MSARAICRPRARVRWGGSRRRPPRGCQLVIVLANACDALVAHRIHLVAHHAERVWMRAHVFFVLLVGADALTQLFQVRARVATRRGVIDAHAASRRRVSFESRRGARSR